MARFIEIPHGRHNPETNTTERTTTLVNMECIISVSPMEDNEYMTKVTLKGAGKTLGAYRKYDTLRTQLTNRDADVFEVFPEEEITAAYHNGYLKGLADSVGERQELQKEFIAKAIEWLSTNPLIDNWRSRFNKDMMSR